MASAMMLKDKVVVEALGLQVSSGKLEKLQQVVRGDATLCAKIINEANIRLTP